MPETKHEHDKLAAMRTHPFRRIFLGRALRNEKLEGELLPKKIALPIS
jgi:hypothetical protein